MGLVNSAYLGQRPWTRLQCAEFVQEIRQNLAAEQVGSQVESFYRSLESEFAPELETLATGSSQGVDLESIYARTTQIGGRPLNDSYHFGQTMVNDFGRPYGEGNSDILGFSARGEYGRFFGYVHAEYQHAPGIPALTPDEQATLAVNDRVPVSPNTTGRSAVNYARLLDTYLGVRLGNSQISFGKQSLYEGPTEMGSLLYSDNVDPLYMLRISQVEPKSLPGFLRFLGPLKSEFFIAKMSGHQYPARPFIHGEKVSLKPTKNLEIGFSRTTVFLGEGHGFTFGRFFQSYFSVGDTLTSNQSSSDPGDRKGGLDISYRVPGLRNWLTVYTDSFTDDDPSPLAAPHRAPWNPGFYLSHVPGIPKLDFRAEGVFTDLLAARSFGGFFVYYNVVYKDTYLQKGYLLGNVVGRQGKAVQLQSTYWLNARSNLQFQFREGRVNRDFIPGGGSQNTGSVQANFFAGKGYTVSSRFQYERWNFPFLAPNPKTDVAGSLELQYEPKFGLFRRRNSKRTAPDTGPDSLQPE